MTYNEIFSQILSQEKNIQNATMYILKNNRPKQIKVFPNEISDEAPLSSLLYPV